MSTALMREIDAVLMVANNHGLSIGPPSAVLLLHRISVWAWDKPHRAGREQLAAREMFRPREQLAPLMSMTGKSIGRLCQDLEARGLRVRREGRTAGSNKAMIYRLPTVKEFARALGFEGEQVKVFEAMVQENVDVWSTKQYGKDADSNPP